MPRGEDLLRSLVTRALRSRPSYQQSGEIRACELADRCQVSLTRIRERARAECWPFRLRHRPMGSGTGRRPHLFVVQDLPADIRERLASQPPRGGEAS